MMLKHAGFGVSTLLSEAIKVHLKDEAIMSPGDLVKGLTLTFPLGFTLMFGTAGLPHILMHFSTISDAEEVHKNMFYATDFIGYFYILVFIIGFDTILSVSTSPDLKDATGILTDSNNIVAVYPADAVGDSLLLGLISTMTFATTLAVIAGLTLAGAPTVSHDLYTDVFRDGKANEKGELQISRVTTVTLGVVAIVLGILLGKQNIAFMVDLAFFIAASCNFPVLPLSMYWKKSVTHGIMIGGWIGLIAAASLTVLGPTVWVWVLGHEKAIYLYGYPTLFSMIVTFINIWFFSITSKSAVANEERAHFFPQFIRFQTDLGASGAVAH